MSRPYTGQVNIYTSKDFFFHTFIQRLKEKGITSGVHTYADCPVIHDSIATFCTIRRPIRQVLERALKKSDNLCAESMFYHLAAQHAPHHRVTADDGTDAIADFMKTVLGFNPDNYKIVDGSGVSLYNYISPRLLLEYLKYAYYHRDIFLPLYDALPIAGGRHVAISHEANQGAGERPCQDRFGDRSKFVGGICERGRRASAGFCHH